MSITPAFSPGPWITFFPLVGKFLRWSFDDLYEQCSFHIAENIPSSKKFGFLPIRFIIFLNEQIPEENTNILSKSENKKPKPADFKNLKFKEFKQVLVDNYAGYYLGEYENKSITLSESGYIELDGKRVGADESFDVWEELFINRANLQPKSKEEFEEIKKAKEEEEKNNYLEKLKKEYRFRKIEVNVKNAFGNVNKIMYEVIDFLPPKNGEERCFDLVVKGEDGKTYKFDNVRYDIFVSYLV